MTGVWQTVLDRQMDWRTDQGQTSCDGTALCIASHGNSCMLMSSTSAQLSQRPRCFMWFDRSTFHWVTQDYSTWHRWVRLLVFHRNYAAYLEPFLAVAVLAGGGSRGPPPAPVRDICEIDANPMRKFNKTFPSPCLGINQYEASRHLVSCSMISSLQKTMLVRYWHPARVNYMHCEFSVTTDCQPARSKTFFALLFSQRYVTVPRRCRASARQVIVQDWMHSYDVARNMATVLMMFRLRLLMSLLQLTSHCSSEFSTTNFTCSSRCCLTRLSAVINYAGANTECF